MTSTNQNGQEESGQRCKESDAVGMFTQHFLGNLNHPVHTARCLQHTSTGYGSDYDVDNISRRGTRLQSETEH